MVSKALIVYAITVMAVWYIVAVWVAENDPPHLVSGIPPQHAWWMIPLVWTLTVATVGCFWPLVAAWWLLDLILDNFGEDDD